MATSHTSDGPVQDTVPVNIVGSSGTAAVVDTELAAAIAAGDSMATQTTAPVISYNALFSGGTTWLRAQANRNATMLASAARTATNSTSAQTNINHRGLHLAINVTSAGTGSITVKVEGYDAVPADYYTVLEGTAITTTGKTVLKVYPGITASANAAACDVLPPTWRVTVTHNNANTITYSVVANLVL